MKAYTYPGNIYIIAAPSGTGKSTLLSRLLSDIENLEFSISHTTRPPRQGEQHGREYFFVDNPTFEELIEKNAFLEWARVHDNYYGTSKAHIEEKLRTGVDIILDIDVQGAAMVKQALPSAVSIFIFPPSMKALENRLRGRGKDNEDVIRKRLDNAWGEIQRAENFDYFLINDDLDNCYQNLRTVVLSNRFRGFRRRKEMAEIIENFHATR